MTLSARDLNADLFIVSRCDDDEAAPKMLSVGADREATFSRLAVWDVGGACLCASHRCRFARSTPRPPAPGR